MKNRTTSTLGLRLAVAISTAALLSATFTHAADRFWDGTDTSGNADGGDGIWTTGGTNWDNAATGGANAAWENYDNAFLGGAPGAVTITSSINANNLTFTTDGYSVTGGTLNLGSPAGGPNVSVGAGLSATISSSITRAGSNPNWIKTGDGTLIVNNGSNNYGGGTTISGGELVTVGSSLGTGTINLNSGKLTLATVNDARYVQVQNNGTSTRRMDIGEIEAFLPTQDLGALVGNAAGTGALNPTTDLAYTVNGASNFAQGATSGFSQPHGNNTTGPINAAENTAGDTWSSNGVGNFITVKLGSDSNIGTVRVHQRNGCCQERLQDFTVNIFADDGGSPGALLGTASFPGQPANSSFGQLSFLPNLTNNVNVLTDSAIELDSGVPSATLGNLNFSAPAILTVNSVDGGQSLEFTGSTVLAAGNNTINTTGTANVTVNAVSGGNLIKTGDGTLNVEGSYSAGTATVNGGSLQIGPGVGGDSFNPSTGSIVVNTNGTLRLGQDNPIQNAVGININGNGTFDLNGFGDVIGNISGDGNITLGSGSLVLDNLNGQDFSGDISGNGSLTVRGNVAAGTQTLSGTNTYNGTTTIDDGTLQINSPLSLPGAALVNSSGTLNLLAAGTTTYGNDISGAGLTQVTMSGGTTATWLSGDLTGLTGTLELIAVGSTGNKLVTDVLNAPDASLIVNPGAQLLVNNNTTFEDITVSGTGNNENRGAIRINGGTLNGPISLIGDTTIGPEGGTIASSISSGTSGLKTLRIGGTAGNPFETVFTGQISDGAGQVALELINNNSGNNNRIANGTNSYSGGTTLIDGGGSGTRLTIAGISGTPYGSGAITIGQAATDNAGIFFITANQTLTNDIVFNTRLGTDRRGIRSDATNITLSGDITANLADATFSSHTTGSFNLTGQVTGAEGLRLVDDNGNRNITVTLNNAAMNNNYQGDTTIEGSNQTIILGASNQIPNGPNAGNVVNNGTLNMNGNDDTINGLSGTGAVNGGSGTPTLTLGDNDTTASYDGTINNAGGVLGLTKIGTGTQTLTGAGGNNTYTGLTQVDGGVLAVGGSFGGDGAIQGDITVNNTGTFQLLQGNIITNTSVVTVNGTGAFDMNGQNEAIGYIAGDGNVSGGNLLELDLGGSAGETFTGTLNNPGDLNVRGANGGTGAQTFNGDLTFGGAVQVGTASGDTGRLNVTGGSVTAPTWNVGAAAGSTGIVQHSGGLVDIAGDNTIGVVGTGSYALSGTGVLDFGDTLAMTQQSAAPGNPASTLTVGANGTFEFTGGTLQNVTTIDVTSATGQTFNQDGGDFVIGVDGNLNTDGTATRAITTIDGNFDQSTGNLLVDIFGPNSHGFNGESAGSFAIDVADPMTDLDSDLLHVMGDASLNGILDVDANELGLAPFAWYDVVLSDGLIDLGGDFDIDGDVSFFRVIDDPLGPGQILQVAVPEPASIAIWTLLGLALGGYGYARVRRRK